MFTGKIARILFGIGYYQNRVEGRDRLGVTRNRFGRGRVVAVWGGGVNIHSERAILNQLKDDNLSVATRKEILNDILAGDITFNHTPEGEVKKAIEPLKTHQNLGDLAKSVLEKLFPEKKPVTPPPPPNETEPETVVEETTTVPAAISPVEIELAHLRDRFGFTSSEKLTKEAEQFIKEVKDLREKLEELRTSQTKLQKTKDEGERLIVERKTLLTEIGKKLKAKKEKVEEKYAKELNDIQEQTKAELEKIKTKLGEVEDENLAKLQNSLHDQLEAQALKRQKDINQKIKEELAKDPEVGDLLEKKKITEDNLKDIEQYHAEILSLLAKIADQITTLEKKQTELLGELEKIKDQAIAEKSRVLDALTQEVISKFDAIWGTIEALKK